MEYNHFKLDLVQLGGLLLSMASAYLMIRKSKKQRKEKEKPDENDQASGG